MKIILKRMASLLLVIVMCLSLFAGFGITVFAAGTEGKMYLIALPRASDEQYSDQWGHDNLELLGGWSVPKSRYTMLYSSGSFAGDICYCIEPGVKLNIGDVAVKKDESYWDNYPSQYNNTISPRIIKLLIGRILQYGYTGKTSTKWVTQNPEYADHIAEAYATQLLIWETIVGERNEDFAHVNTGNKDAIKQVVGDKHPLRSQIFSHYNRIEASVQKHSKVPAFCARTTGKAPEIGLEWNGSEYTVSLNDTNGVLSGYTFTSDNDDLKFTVSGNTLTISTKEALSSVVTIKAEKKSGKRKGLVVWSDEIIVPRYGQQDAVSYTQEVNDPVEGFLKIKVLNGSAKIVKTSEDGKVDGISFRIQGNGIDKTVKTANGGQIQVDNLMPGIYTVTEQTENKYEPQETRRITVVSGQTTTVTFNNTLKRGSLKVVKTAEDKMTEGVTFHLYGTSLSGLKVDEYAVTDSSGTAVFEDVLISGSTPYTLEEVNTDVKYVVPEKQPAVIEWNKVTNKDFRNVLKKWSLTVTKSDSEKGLPQGDASLAGAKYGIYKSGQLMDVYETDRSGQFTTKSYICGNDWSLREIEPSEGYLLNTESLHIGAEAGLYTAEFNLAPPLDSYETVKKGKIAIIKHCDDGSTQIETPEEGAEFQVFLKSAGSYADAEETERDILICDSYGFAESKLLPYGIYTVKQTKGWDSKELMPAFDVFVSENNEVYRYLINNATFESLIEIVKKDAETGKVIPAAGVGFKVRNTDTGEYIVQHINYPTPVDIDTYYTDTTGKLMMPEPLGFGNYELIEQCSAYGYVLDSMPVPFKVDGTQTTVVVEKHNIAQKGTITVGKTGEVFSSVTETDGIYQPVYDTAGLAGAVYEVYANETVSTPDGTVRAEKDQLVAVIETDSDGFGTSVPLYLGKYRIVEKTAPYSMCINTEPKYVELTYAGQEIEITETATSFYNERQKAELSLSKILEQNELFGIGGNGEILSVQFGLFAAEDLTAADGSVIPKDGLLEIVNCTENGKAVFKTDIPVGAKLYVKEIAVDEHYLLSDEKYPVEFVYAGQDIAVLEIQVNDGEVIENDLIYGNIKGLKIDRETEEPIAGALFGLFCADKTEFTEETAVLTAESQPDGVFTFEQIPYGNWIVKELRPADSFLLSGEIYPVTVSEHEQLIEITAVNDRIPEIGTTAAVDGEKEICATEVFTLTDTVSYKHLIPGKEYVLKGVLMDKSTGKPLVIDGEEIRSETVFTPDAPTGEAIVEFIFDSKYIKEDTDIVVFESLYKDGKELAVHADIEDEGQTVKVKIPEIRTQATADGKKEITANGRVKIEDVVSYNNLTPGKEYTVKGVLMDKSTGEPLLVAGEEICSSFTFKPDAPDGEITVTFVFDASGLTSAADIVVFESLYRDDVEIAVHADIEDEGQTVKITPPVPDVPQTGDDSNLGFWIGLGGTALGAIIACVIIYLKSRKDNEDE